MGRGGAREGAGRPKKVTANDNQPRAVPAEPRRPTMFSDAAVEMILRTFNERSAAARMRPRTEDWNPYIIRPDRFGVVAQHVRQNRPSIAMDNQSGLMGQNGIAVQAWQAGGLLGNAVSEGLLFLGYPYLAELAQRPEFRLIAEIRAEEMVRKWTKFRGVKDESTKEADAKNENKPDDDEEGDNDGANDEDLGRAEEKKANGEKPRSDARNKEIEEKIKELQDFEAELKVKDWFKAAAAQNDFFGITHLLLDLKGTNLEDADNPELKVNIGNGRNDATEAKFGGKKGFLKGIRTIEPVWVYPMAYNSINPMVPTWYDPQTWYVMGTEVHKSQLLQFIAHPVPDILKPAYMFGGLSMTQMAQPYVLNWLRTRESVGELVHAFSVMCLSTNLATTTMPGGSGGMAGDVLARGAMFNAMRDNMGLYVFDKNTEDFKNVSAPLGGLSDLQAQSQEHMASITRIPLVKLTGIQPMGLNATSEGELRAFEETVAGMQEHLFRERLTQVYDLMQYSLWGERDPDITFDFLPLREETPMEKADMRKKEAETDQIRIDSGVVSQEEARQKLASDPDSGYDSIDPDDVPDLLEEEQAGLIPEGAGRGLEAELGQGAEGQQPPQAPQPPRKPNGGGGQDHRPFFVSRDAGLIDFKESEHPRDPDGKFTSGGGGGGGSGKFQAPQYGLPFGPASHGEHKHTPATIKKPKPPLDISKLEKVGGQMGSNPGGVYKDDEGDKYYIKKGKSEAHVRNELTAGALYKLAGSPTLKYRDVKGGGYIATEMAKLDKDNSNKLNEKEIAEARKDFGIHAWLANWDVVGTGGDNLGTVKGVPTALDLGGAMEFRAQGAPKGNKFGNEVGELDTLRSKSMNPDAAKIFGGMTPAELRESVRAVTRIPEKAIRDTVKKFGGDDALADKLIARRNDLANKAELFGNDPNPTSKDSAVVFLPGQKLPVKELNGVGFESWTPPRDWNNVEGQADIDEPEFPEVPQGKKQSTGVIIREADGRVWLARPRNAFGGYEHTFPKGTLESDLSPQANAIKEAYEETGLKTKITGYAGDAEGDSTMTRYYYAEREGGDPADATWEVDGVVLSPKKKLDGFLNRSRDRKLAKGLDQAMDDADFVESEHPRDPDGKFTSGGGGGSSGKAEGGEGKEKKQDTFQGQYILTSKDPKQNHLLTLGKVLAQPTKIFQHYRRLLAFLIKESPKYGTENQIPLLKAKLVDALQQSYKKSLKDGKTDNAKAFAAKLKKMGYPVEPSTAAGPATPPKKWSEQPSFEKQQQELKQQQEPQKISEALGVKLPGTEPTFPPPTEAELTKAKKNVALQLQYLNVPNAPMTPAIMAEIDKFNDKYEGKTLTEMSALTNKVNDFKKLQAKVASMVGEESAKAVKQQQEAAAKAAVAQKEANEKAAAALKKKAAETAEANKAVMQQLGITESEAVGFGALVEMMGGSQKDAIASFKSYEDKVKNLGYPITGFQAKLIVNYTGSGYGSINSALRKGSWSEAQHVYVKMMNKALQAMPTYKGVVKRGTTLPTEQQQLYKAGNVVEERAFTSTSVSAPWSGNTRFTINAIGKRGAHVKKLSSHPGEDEVVFSARTFFKVTKVEGSPGGSMHVYMDEMEE